LRINVYLRSVDRIRRKKSNSHEAARNHVPLWPKAEKPKTMPHLLPHAHRASFHAPTESVTLLFKTSLSRTEACQSRHTPPCINGREEHLKIKNSPRGRMEMNQKPSDGDKYKEQISLITEELLFRRFKNFSPLFKF